MILSILICSLESRKESLYKLLDCLMGQIKLCNAMHDVKIHVETDDGKMIVGAKRNKLLEKAEGEYICFIDDDDEVSDDYIESILGALVHKPDCVGIKLDYVCDGKHTGISHHSIKYDGWRTVKFDNELFFERTPNHLNPVKREIALLVKFPEYNHGEDHVYSNGIKQYLKSEIDIDHVIYKYLYKRNK